VSVAEKNPKLDLITKPSIVTFYVALNNLKKPFTDVRVRQALNYAVDKRAFAKVVYNGFVDPLDSVVPPGLPFYSKQAEWPFDVAKAKQLLKEAGYPDGFETEITGANNTTATRAMQFMQQQLAQVGVKVKVTPLESGTLTQRIWSVSKPEDATVQLYYGGWSASTGDPDWQLRPLLFGESFPPKLFNVAYYKNPEVDAAIKASIATADGEKRAEAYKRAQELIWKDAPWIYLGVERLLAGMAERRVAEIVSERHGLAEILVEAQRAADGAGDLRHLKRMRQPRPVVITLVIDEDLRLVLQPAERRRMDDAVAVALERAARGILALGMQPAAALPRQGGVRRQGLASPQLLRHSTS